MLSLQNMFPKGKFNTNISRNAQYMVLFRSPSDQKQMDIIAERIFAKDRHKFMSVYMKETEKPYQYIILDNHPKTTSEKQVIADVFGDCYAYPNITKSTHSVPEVTQGTPETKSCSIEALELKHKGPNQSAKESERSVKRKVELEKPPAKKQKTNIKNPRKQSKPAKKQAKTKQKTTKPKAKKHAKPRAYKPKFMISPPRESSEEEQFNSEEEQFYSDDEPMNPITDFQDELNSFARQQTGFGPKFVYE